MIHRLRFYLNQEQSPTHYNLWRYLKERGWGTSYFPWYSNFSDKNLQFSAQAAEQLEYKHLLAQLAQQFCPEVMPLTYCINDENWPEILNQIAHRFYFTQDHLVNHIDDLVWILKPALLNNGQEIKIFQKFRELEQHFLSTNRLGGEHVLQRYLTHPHLLRDERKYSLRMFVVTTNYAGSFLYPYGYYNVALHPFVSDEFLDLRPHLTNEHLQDNESNVIQIPTRRFESFSLLYQQIKTILAAIIKGLTQLFPQAFICKKQRALAIYGFDFIVDETGRVWLLEANHGPCFPTSDDHPLQTHLYYDFWQALITCFIEPIAANKPLKKIEFSPFEII